MVSCPALDVLAAAGRTDETPGAAFESNIDSLSVARGRATRPAPPTEDFIGRETEGVIPDHCERPFARRPAQDHGCSLRMVRGRPNHPKIERMPGGYPPPPRINQPLIALRNQKPSRAGYRATPNFCKPGELDRRLPEENRNQLATYSPIRRGTDTTPFNGKAFDCEQAERQIIRMQSTLRTR